MSLRIIKDDTQTYYGHGKLLITGEYFVLDGAQALSLPTKFGQSLRLKILNATDSNLYWVALSNQNKAWLNLVFDTTDLSCINSKAPEAERLTKILTEARKMNTTFLADGNSYAVETKLEFPNEWGLGTSSTLISCVSEWAGVDGYTLLQNTLGGSGYDVACAKADSAILYEIKDGKPHTYKAHWNPPFKDNIYFAYLGRKQLSSEGIKYYKTKLQDKTYAIGELNRLTGLILKTDSLNMFEELLNEHETLIGSQLKMMKVKDQLFSDYWACVKSLGAWGGDFVLLTNERSEEELKAYLKQKGIDTVFSWKELILNDNLSL